MRAVISGVFGLALLAGIAAGARAQADPCSQATLDHAGIRELQEALNRLAVPGTDAGPVDGLCGPQTVAAIESFQQSRGQQPDGIPTPELLAAINNPQGTVGNAEPPATGATAAEEVPDVTLAGPQPMEQPRDVAPADQMILPDAQAPSAQLNSVAPPSILPQTVDPVTGQPRW